jgi:hypothetical protein
MILIRWNVTRRAYVAAAAGREVGADRSFIALAARLAARRLVWRYEPTRRPAHASHRGMTRAAPGSALAYARGLPG